MLTEYIQAHPLQYHPSAQFPPSSHRAAWEGVDAADRADLLALANDWRERPYPLLTAGMYASFVRTGSRKDCENPYFDRRRKLCAAALHICLTDEDIDLAAVEDGLILICEETTWAISAHAGLTAAHPFPDAKAPIIDLFAAQTGMILSFICQLLGDRLHPDLRERVRWEVERRILSPFMHNDKEWWMGFVRKDLCNWTPWIVSNVMMAANVWMTDCTALYTRACGMIDRWLDCVPADGGCDEGAGYWNMAGGAFLDCLMLLEKTCGVNLWDNDKVRRMMAYPELVYLGGGWFANFADCDARPYISGERLQYAGEKTDNPALIRMGVEMRSMPSWELSDTPHLSRLLMRLFSRAAQAEAADVPQKDVWLPDLQVRILEKDGLTVAMKGGHNAESHNHNDVGTFLIAAKGQMQAVDAGNMVYTAKTFSAQRYELWNCRSIYHNVPMIGEWEQHNGPEYAARDVQCSPKGMALDMASAYPAEAGLQQCQRSFCLEGGRLSVRDEVVCDAPQPITWVLMLRHEPVIDQARQCCHLKESGFWIDWSENAPLTASAEPINVTDPRMAKSYPGCLWRLTLSAAPSTHHTQEFLFEA
ncbi:MAG: heparinase II/III family protein [Clostridia bacterium]|nr:heparinase II/III family protein [Clostridia bacterium]